MYKKIKSEKGITLLALTIYIVIFTIIIGIITTISTYFYGNIGEVTKSSKYISEFNKFVMFFSTDIKNYNEAIVTDNTIKFNDEIIYKFENNAIYRNEVIIAQNVQDCKFSLNKYTVNTVTKNIINVNLKIGKSGDDYFENNVDFTLKYW